ncbi:SURF1 family protein [Sphingomonas sp. RS2018]
MKRRLFAALCIALTLAFAALGVWQVERRAWKLDLIARVERRLHAAPVPPPVRWRDDMAYTRVRVAGRFRHDRETLVQALTERGAGWWVMTPLDTGRGILLVNRGFVPAEYRAPSARPPATGTVTVTGLARATEPGGGFLRGNDPAAGRWYSRDVAAIASSRGLSGVAPYFIDADATPNPGGYPVGGLTVVAFRNTHLIYALTWFALAAMSGFGAWLLLRRGGVR